MDMQKSAQGQVKPVHVHFVIKNGLFNKIVIFHKKKSKRKSQLNQLWSIIFNWNQIANKKLFDFVPSIEIFSHELIGLQWRSGHHSTYDSQKRKFLNLTQPTIQQFSFFLFYRGTCVTNDANACPLVIRIITSLLCVVIECVVSVIIPVHPLKIMLA